MKYVESILTRLHHLSLIRHLKNRPALQKILANTGWLFFVKIFRMGVGLFVGVWVARYLGPEQFGVLSYAVAFVGLFLPISKLGLDGIVVREIVRTPESANEILGTAFSLKLAGAVTAFLASIGVIFLIKPQDSLIKIMVAIIAASFIVKTFEAIDLWFRSQVQSKFTVIAQNSAFLLAALLKIGLLLAGVSVIYFAWTNLLEACIATFGLIIAYKIYGLRISDWSFSLKRFNALFRDSWPFIFSGFFAVIFMQIDQIMIGQMLGNQSVGQYSAAVCISTIWYFIPMSIVNSVFPSIIEARKIDEKLYYERLRKLFNVMALCAYSVIIPLTFLSNLIVNTLYGKEYIQSAYILQVHIFSCIFLFLGLARGPWINAENFTKFVLLTNSIGAVSNVILNYVLIGWMGTIGAAYSTLISYFLAYIASNILFAKTRPILLLQIKAIFLYDYLGKVINRT